MGSLSLYTNAIDFFEPLYLYTNLKLDIYIYQTLYIALYINIKVVKNTYKSLYLSPLN